jgi:hypothetical protein
MGVLEGRWDDLLDAPDVSGSVVYLHGLDDKIWINGPIYHTVKWK